MYIRQVTQNMDHKKKKESVNRTTTKALQRQHKGKRKRKRETNPRSYHQKETTTRRI